MSARSAALSVTGLAFRYAVIIFGSLLLVSLVYYQATIGRRPPQLVGKHLEQKVNFYKENARDFNVVFIGDSRTYCGIHPDLLDPLLGTKSINLATMALWLPLQYALIQDILQSIAPGTTVVWSIGHQNFHPETPVRNVYPVGLHALQLYAWGLKNPGLFDNFAAFNPVLALYHDRGKLRQGLLTTADRRIHWPQLVSAAHAAPTVTYPAPPPPDVRLDVVAETERLAAYYHSDPRIDHTNVIVEEGRVVAATLALAHGSSYWVELDPAFFRASQAKDSLTLTEPPAQLDPALWQIEDATLDSLQERGIRVVLNEMQEAPHVYGDPRVRDRYHHWLEQALRPTLDRHRATLVSVDFSQLMDNDYFDYNHLNSDGIKKFTPMLADQLAPFFPSSPPPP